MTLQVRQVATGDEFSELAATWTHLLERRVHASPFLTHDWFACCWLACAPETQAEVLVVEDAGRVVAVVPLRRWRERVRGLPVRCLGFLESPDTAVADFVLDGEAAPVVAAVLQHLHRRRDWDVVRFRKLPTGSPTLAALEAALPGHFAWRRGGSVISPYVAIRGTWTDYWNGTSQRFKKTVRSVQNRLSRAGKVTIDEHHAVDGEARLLDDAIDVSRRSWKAERGVAIATMGRMPEFFAELSRRASARGWLSLWFLRLDGRAIATEYQLHAGGIVHALRADYDLEYRALSPGSALNAAIVKALFERGDITEYDMGPGLNEYKLRWATGHHELVEIDIYASHVRGRILAGLECVVAPAARRMRGWWTSAKPEAPESTSA